MRNDTILLEHGSGGRASRWLVEELLVPYLKNQVLERLDDHAEIELEGTRLAFTTDSFVVDPIFFPGGDIGKLAVNGTVNDLAMGGAKPLFLSAGLILEEGLPIADLERIMHSMAEATKKAQVHIVTGDTKVVAHGAADKIFINTSGVGLIPKGVALSGHRGKVGDRVLISGPIGEHGIAVMAQRSDLDFVASCKSDTAPLADLVAQMLYAYQGIHSLRDPTRGGLAATLNELAVQSGVRIEVEESAIPITESVEGACELLGLDPLHLANEGVLVALVPAEGASLVLDAMRNHPLGHKAQIIGEVCSKKLPAVILRTPIGGKRVLAVPTGVQLPRIC